MTTTRQIKNSLGNTINRNLDNVTRKYTAFESFTDLCLSIRTGYWPTLYVNSASCLRERKALKFLADYYDLTMRAMNIEKRAYRC